MLFRSITIFVTCECCKTSKIGLPAVWLGSPSSLHPSYVVTTPISSITVRGTSFYVSLKTDENGDLLVDISVFDGKVETIPIMPDGNPGIGALIESGKSAGIVSNKLLTEFVFDNAEID